MKQKHKIPKKKTALKKQKKISNWLIIGLVILFVSLFIIIIFTGQRQVLQGDAQTAITPTFGTIGDCQTNGTCPTGTTTAPTTVAITGPIQVTAANPTSTTIQPCTSAQNARVSLMAAHRKNHISSSKSNGFLQLILQFLQQLLQLLEQLFGGGTTTPTPVIPQPSQGVQPTQGTQPSTGPNPTQAPCPPLGAPQPTTGAGQPTSGPVPTTPVTTTGTPVTTGNCTNPVFTSSDPQGTWTDPNGEYVNNNAWNTAEAGPQTISVCSLGSWFVTSNQKDIANDSGSVKTFPSDCSCSLSSTKTISSYTNITSSFAESIPAMGEWDAGYDMFTGSGQEIMIQNQTHEHPEDVPFPSGSTAVTIDGVAYHVLNQGDFIVVLNDNQIASGTVNILHVFQWLISKGWVKSTDTLDMIGYGVEISVTESSPGVQGQERFNFTNWSLTAN